MINCAIKCTVKRFVLVVLAAFLWLCSGCGGGSDAPILSVSETTVSVSYMLGGEKRGRAQFTLTNSGGGSLSYLIVGNPRFLGSASRIRGTLSSSESHVISLFLDCNEPGTLSDSLTIQGDNGASETVLVSVECIAPPIVLEIKEPPARGTGTPVEILTMKMSWSFSSPWSGQDAVDYSITADHGQASATPASGSAGLGETVAVDLTYECESLEHVTVGWTVSAGEQQLETEWDVVCEAPPVAVTIDALAGAMGTPLSFPSESLQWSFTSPWDGHGAEEYVMESDVDLAVSDPASGVAEPGDPIAVQLTYRCSELGAFDVSWTLRIGDQHEIVTWNVHCVAPPVAIEIDSVTLESSGILPNGAKGLLRWSFASEWEGHGAEQFGVRASDPLAHAVPDRGSANPGEVITHDLTYACNVPGARTITWSIIIGEQHEEADLVMDCDAPEITLTIEEIKDSAGLVDEDVDGQIMWFFTSPWDGQGAVEYTISTDDERASIDQPSGSASLGEVVVGQLAFPCEEIGGFLVGWTINVGEVKGGANWAVQCVEMSLSVEAVADSTAPFPDPALGNLSWSYSVDPDIELELDFSIVADDVRASIRPATGSAEPDKVVNVDLTFDCTDVDIYTVELTVDLAGSQEQVPWEVECTVPPIQITIEDIEDSAALLDENAVGQMEWSFTSPWDGQGAVDYTVTTSDSRASATPSSSTAAKDTTQRIDLSFNCRDLGDHQVIWIVDAGGVQAQATWKVKCIRSSLYVDIITDNIDATGTSLDNATAQLEWVLRSLTDAQDSYTYSISTNNAQATVDPSTGTAKPGVNITTTLQYDCYIPEETVTTIVTIDVAEMTQEVSWQVECLGRSIRIGRMELFQSPMIARARRVRSEDGAVSLEETSLINAVTGRDATVAVTVEHELRDASHQVEAKVTLADNTEIPLQVYRKIWRTAPGDSDSQLWETDYVFFIDGDMFLSTTSLTVTLAPVSTDNIPSIHWNFSNLQFGRMGDIRFKLFRLDTSAGVPDEITQAHVDSLMEWLNTMHPIVGFSTIVSAEVITTDTGSFDPLRYLEILDDKWVSESTHDEYYYAIYLLPPNGGILGVAYLSRNAAVGVAHNDVTFESTFVHEIGHTFSLKHSDCGGPDGVDPNARPNGSIGPNRGWRALNEILVFPGSDHRDVMSYCEPYFVSDYAYRQALAYLSGRLNSRNRNIVASHQTNETSHTGAVTKEGKPARSIALAGSIDAFNRWTLRLQEYNPNPPLPVSDTGSYTLKLFDSTGNVVLTQRIDTYQSSHGERSTWGTRVQVPSTDPVELAIYDELGSVVFQEDLSL